MEPSFMESPIIFRFDVAADFASLTEDLTIFSDLSARPHRPSTTTTEVIFPPIQLLASTLVNRVTSYLSQPPTPHPNSPVLPRATKKPCRAYFWHKLYTFLEPLAQAEDDEAFLEEDFPVTADASFRHEAMCGLQQNPLVLCPEGVGGTYFLLDQQGDKFGVFKPVDEEPGAPGNPKKLVMNPLLPPGGGAIREVAAFALDKGWAGVPPTYPVNHIKTQLGIKTGSIQKFVQNDGDSTSVGSSSFLVNDVHRIGTLDIRLANLDRNGENILVKREGQQHSLIPIDHAYILPEKLAGDCFFEWMHWPQAKVPFSAETLEYLANINVEEDARVLHELGIPQKNIRTMRISTLFLKWCAAIGKNLFEIATLICRDHTGQPSQLEILVEEAHYQSSVDDGPIFYEHFQSLLNNFSSSPK